MSSPIESSKAHGENPSGANGNNQQQTSVKRKRLTQACDACRKKKVKCSGEKPCDNCTRLGVICTYLPSTRKRGPRVGLVESLEKRLLQMERLLKPLKEQGLVDESDSQTLGPTLKKPRLNSTEPYSADNFTDITDNQFYSNQNSSEPSPQPKEYTESPKETKSHSSFHSSSQLNNPNYTHSAQQHHTYSQSEFVNYFSQSPQSSSSSPQLSTPAENQSPVINQTKTGEESQDESIPLIKTENSDEGTLIFFGKTSATPGFRTMKELERCHAKIKNESLQNQESTDTTLPEQTEQIMNSHLHIPPTLVLSRSNDFPPQDIIEHLTSCFFRFVDTQVPMFHEATFKRQLRQGKVSPFLILSMCAVSARFSDDPRIKKTPPYMSGESFENSATQMIVSSFDTSSVEYVQAYILLTMHTYGSLKGPRTWMYIGMAIRMAHELGLHKIDEPLPNTSNKIDSEIAFIKKETKRRTFWACFMLDRFSACALGRPSLIVEEDCDVRLPCIESIWTMEHPFESPAIDDYLRETYVKHDTRFNLSTIGIFSIFCSTITLLGRVSQHVNRSKPTGSFSPWDPRSEYAILANELEEWYRSIAPSYGYSKERLNTFSSTRYGALFASTHLLYYAVVVVLNRPNLIAPQNDDYPIEFIEKSAAKCSTAAMNVSSIAADVIQHGLHNMCPLTLYPVYATATIHINESCNEDINIANAAKENLKIHERYMNEMQPFWAMATKMCIMMKDMRNIRNEQSDPTCERNIFFFDRKKYRTKPRTELMSTGTDAGFMTLWNRTNSTNNTPPETNVNVMFTMGFPDQLLSPRWLFNGSNDNSNIGDSWANFLRSQSPITPGSLMRYTKKDNGENENDYFSQDMTLYNNNNSSYIYDPTIIDMPVGQTIPEWLPGRFIQANRQTSKQWTDINPIVQDSINQIPLSSSNIYRTVESSNEDDQ